MTEPPLIKVTSVTFSRHAVLRRELEACFPRPGYNERGREFDPVELRSFLADASGAVVSLAPVDDGLLSACPRLKAIAKFGVGLDNIDQDACRRRGVSVGWTPEVNRRSVAEVALCAMIGLRRNLFASSALLRQGVWRKDGGRELSGCTVGILGLGPIGRELVLLLKPFGCKVLANDLADLSSFCGEHGVTMTSSKEELYGASDVVSLHVPLTTQTRHLIDERALSHFRSTAFLVNTSRGPVVKLAALKAALQEGRLAGAALDVFETEPPEDAELLSLPNLVPTPHIAGSSEEGVLAMGRSAIGHLRRHFGR